MHELCENHLITASEKAQLLQLGSSNPLPSYRSQRPQDLHLAAVMHAAEGRWLLSGTQLVHTHWAVGSRAWGALGIFHFKPRGDEQ